MASFLGTIGRNGEYIRHMCINFPKFLDLEQCDIALEDSIGIFANVQSGFANLSTLITSIYTTNAKGLRFNALNNPKVVTEALMLVDTRVRAI